MSDASKEILQRLALAAVLTAALATLTTALVLATDAQPRPKGPEVVVAAGGTVPGTAKHLKLVGDNRLMGRGMNAALAVLDDAGVVYVGNRTDGAPEHPDAGVLVVDTRDPSHPEVVNEIGPPFAGNPSETTRELRIWQEQRILVVLNLTCSEAMHDCAGAAVTPSFRFFDLSDPAHPTHIMDFTPTQADGETREPHEFFLWVDPKDPGRAYIWATLPTADTSPTEANLVIWDISGVASGVTPQLLAQGTWNGQYELSGAAEDFLLLHSIDVSVDGETTTLAYWGGNTLVLDTSEVVESQPPLGTVIDLNDNLLTSPRDRPQWGTARDGCPPGLRLGCAESHSAEQVPGRDLVINTDEVYGTFAAPFHGCPWGWVRLIDTSDASQPFIASEYRTTKNVCPADDELTQQFTSYASHNPTVTPNLALVTWHSAGLQVVDIRDERQPRQAGWFSPTPLEFVATEDPALKGPNKVTMWSYPVVDDGLIYVVDLRNGLYVLKYQGRFSGEIERLDFLEGNSNQGDEAELEMGRHR